MDAPPGRLDRGRGATRLLDAIRAGDRTDVQRDAMALVLQELAAERIRYIHGLPGFDPTTILLVAPVEDPARLVGFCRVVPYRDDDGRPEGDLGPVGLVREWRGRGIGRQLLRWGVHDLRRRGAEDVFLSVEGENEGALRLYASMGFERHVEWPHWTITVAGEIDDGHRVG